MQANAAMDAHVNQSRGARPGSNSLATAGANDTTSRTSMVIMARPYQCCHHGQIRDRAATNSSDVQNVAWMAASARSAWSRALVTAAPFREQDGDEGGHVVGITILAERPLDMPARLVEPRL